MILSITSLTCNGEEYTPSIVVMFSPFIILLYNNTNTSISQIILKVNNFVYFDDIQFKALIPRQGNHLIRDFIYLNYLHQERHNCTSTKCYDAFCATLVNAIHNGEDRKGFQPNKNDSLSNCQDS